MKPPFVLLGLLVGSSIPSLSAQRILHLDFLVENRSDRAGESAAWITAGDLALLPGFDGFSFVVTTTHSPDLPRDLSARRTFELASQAIDGDGDGKAERVGVLVPLQPGESKVITLHSGAPAQMVRLKGRFPNPISASRLGGGRGIVWESENVAFAWRQDGAVRPVTKLSARPVLEQMPAARLLGGEAAAFATIPTTSGEAEVIAAGPVAAGARIAGPTVESTYLIGRGSQWTQVRARFRNRALLPRIGLPSRPGEIRRSDAGWIASWGGEPKVGLAVWVPSRYLATTESTADRFLSLRPDADGWVEYSFAAYAADEQRENVVEPGETSRRLPEVPGAERYGVASARILLRPPRRTAAAFWPELAADLQSIARPPRVTRLSSQATTYTSLLPAETLQPGAPKSYRSALDLMIRRVRTLTEQSEGKLWFSSDPAGQPVFKDRSWGEGYLVSMLWDGFEVTGDAWYKSAALAANQRMLGGEEREFHATGLNYWNASVRSYRETADPPWRTSALRCADMMARIADPITGLIPENGPAQRKQPEDPYHRSNYIKIDALVGLPVLWWAYEETKDRRYRDSSTSAICAYGLLRMSALEPDPALARFYAQLGRRMVDSLIDRYLTPVGPADRRPPGMLAHACYTKPEEGEFIWGNYSLLRALCWLRTNGTTRLP